MRILKCDRCGHEVKDTKGIIGREFEYHEFQTLYDGVVPGIKDVCGKCYADLQKARSAANSAASQTHRKTFLQLLGLKP